MFEKYEERVKQFLSGSHLRIDQLNLAHIQLS